MVASSTSWAGVGMFRRLLGVLGRGLVALSLSAALLTVAGLGILQHRGEQVMVVLSGSMAPTFDAGDAVLVRSASAADLLPGTIVTFHAVGDPEHLTTHRIVRRYERPEGLFLQTKGDANTSPDPDFVPGGAVVGIMAESVPYLGRWLAFFQSQTGRTVVLALPLLLLAGAQTLQMLGELRRVPRLGGARGPAVRTAVVAVVAVVAMASGTVIARMTSAVFNEQVPDGGNAFATSAYCNGTTTYDAVVLADTPTFYHRFSESSGTTAGTAVGTNTGIYTGGYTLGAAGATACETTSPAVQLNGSSGHVIRTSGTSVTSPAAVSVEAWFRTSTGGGKLVGFGTQRAAASGSGNMDRHLYLSDTGVLYFGVHRTTRTVVSSGTATYLDDRWHHAVGTLGSTGTRLYVDGAQVAANAGATGAGATYNGYWRIGYDTLTGWTAAPTNPWFTGSLDEVAVYPRAITAAEVTEHYNEARR